MPAPVCFVVPAGVEDQRRPSGGNRYDLELLRELGELGADIQLMPVAGSWPRPDDDDLRELGRRLEALPEGATVLWDGLIACGTPDTVHAALNMGLRQVIIVLLPLADETGLDPQVARDLEQGERHALHLANAVVATSRWTATELTEFYGLPGVRVHVAPPGVHLRPVARGSSSGRGNLLAVGSISRRKGHDTLIEALAALPRDLPWQLKLVGAEVDAVYAARLRAMIAEASLEERISLLGPRTGTALDDLFAEADLLVHAPHKEPWGMVISEALACGMPVYASDVGGVPEALGHAHYPGSTDPERPGRLIPPGDSAAWSEALGEWLCELRLRDRLRTLAEQRQRTLSRWRTTALEVDMALRGFESTPWEAVPAAMMSPTS